MSKESLNCFDSCPLKDKFREKPCLIGGPDLTEICIANIKAQVDPENKHHIRIDVSPRLDHETKEAWKEITVTIDGIKKYIIDGKLLNSISESGKGINQYFGFTGPDWMLRL